MTQSVIKQNEANQSIQQSNLTQHKREQYRSKQNKTELSNAANIAIQRRKGRFNESLKNEAIQRREIQGTATRAKSRQGRATHGQAQQTKAEYMATIIEIF